MINQILRTHSAAGSRQDACPFGPPWQSARGTLDCSEKPASVEAPTLFRPGAGERRCYSPWRKKGGRLCLHGGLESREETPEEGVCGERRRIARNYVARRSNSKRPFLWVAFNRIVDPLFDYRPTFAPPDPLDDFPLVYAMLLATPR